MKIALISFEYPPETGFGGIGTYTWHHARALVKLGHEVHVLTGARHEAPMSTAEEDGVIVHRFWAGGAGMASLRHLGRFRMWWSRQRLENALSMSRGLAQLEGHHQFDVIEMPECGAEGALITRRVDVPTVVRIHSPSRLIMPFYDVGPADVALCGAVERRALRAATALTACSQFVAKEVAAKLNEQRPIRVIRNGLDLDWLDSAGSPQGTRERFGLPEGKPLILFVGRMERRKGVHLLPRLAARILERFDVSLALVGDDLFGYVANTLMPYVSVRRLKGSIHVLGSRPLPEVRSLVQAADIVLLPSLWENCPYSYLEAMGAGKAVLGSNQGGVPELIMDGVNGRLATNDDVGSFSERLVELIEDAGQRSRLGFAARRKIRRSHDAIEVARQTAGLYADLIAGRAL